MKKIIFIAILLSLLSLHAQDFRSGTNNNHRTGISWWEDARFGLFIHWGIYSIPAGEWNGQTDYAEWIREQAQIPLKTYETFVGQFNPAQFNPEQWVALAKNAGMKYIVITTKHHDGFCLFDSKYTTFDIMSTPYRRDIIKELADAAHKAGMKIGFYYSIMDWHHPDYLPRRSWENDSGNTSYRSTKGASFDRYIQYMKNQLRELLTNYGKVSVLWFDGDWENTWNQNYGRELYQFVKKLQPDIIVNNRLGGDHATEPLGDYVTPEQFIPDTAAGVDWETCMTMNDHWGYNKHDSNWKSAKELIRDLADIASKGGNFLLNIGPTAQGVFPGQAIERLKEIGAWMKINGESIYGTQAGPFKNLSWGKCTQRKIQDGTRLYLHVFDWQSNGTLIVPGIQNSPVRAFFLSDPGKKSLKIKRVEDGLAVALPGKASDPIDNVVVLDIHGAPDIYNAPSITSDFNIFIDSVHVQLASGRSNVLIHYTDDGTVPTINSPMYSAPFVIHKTSAVMARAFTDSEAVSPAAEKLLTKVKSAPSVEVKNTVPGVHYQYYEGDWRWLPDFDSMEIQKSGLAKNFELLDMKRKENFAYQFNGFLNIPSDGVYRFYLGSDDGSRLYLDNQLLVDNDGLHAFVEKSGVAALAKGMHPVRVDFFQKSGSYELHVMYEEESVPKQKIPDALLFH